MKRIFEDYDLALQKFRNEGRLRSIPDVLNTSEMFNLSSNDYLGLAQNMELRRLFIKELSEDGFPPFSSSSARLLIGNFAAHEELEETLCRLYGRASLLFNSGYHANIGIIPALADKQTLILADKWVHASIIDGIRLSEARTIRYRHGDYQQLTQLLHKHVASYKRVIIITESVFSMDGDEADLWTLVALKNQFQNVILYVDEAHAVGVRGKKGLGCAEEKECMQEIDVLIGTFGKALASVGAFVICDELIKRYIVNSARSFIFSTSLPPINALWSNFIMKRLEAFIDERKHLQQIGREFRKQLADNGVKTSSTSHIVPFIVGESEKATHLSEELRQNGFYVLPIRPPTVPQGTARLRFSFTANMPLDAIDRLITLLL